MYNLYVDMIVPSHGHNVAPILIEARIKKEIPFLSNVMLVGDGQDYICCLLTLKVCNCLCTCYMVFFMTCHNINTVDFD